MNESIIIDRNLQKYTEIMPYDMIPERVILSLTFLVPIKLHEQGVRLFLYNYSPDSWKLWFPPYHFFNWSIDRKQQTYLQLIASAKASCPDVNLIQPEGHLPKSVAAIKDKFGLSELGVDSKPILEGETWLKFSKTKNQWTFYFFNYYLVNEVNNLAILIDQSDPLKCMMPLYGPEFYEVLASEKYNNLGVVDNLVNFLRKQEHVDVLVSRALE